jgi:hypothetical protein
MALTNERFRGGFRGRFRDSFRFWDRMDDARGITGCSLA